MLLITLARFEQTQQLETGGTKVLVMEDGLTVHSSILVSREDELVLGGAAGGGGERDTTATSLEIQTERRPTPLFPLSDEDPSQVAAPVAPWLEDGGVAARQWSPQYQSAMRYLYTRLNPSSCTAEHTVVRIPIGRGYVAFRIALSRFLPFNHALEHVRSGYARHIL